MMRLVNKIRVVFYFFLIGKTQKAFVVSGFVFVAIRHLSNFFKLGFREPTCARVLIEAHFGF
jgi:hypothetical protein